MDRQNHAQNVEKLPMHAPFLSDFVDLALMLPCGFCMRWLCLVVTLHAQTVALIIHFALLLFRGVGLRVAGAARVCPCGG